MASRAARVREVVRLVRQHLNDHPEVRVDYEVATRICHIFARPAFYEISDRCNLKCEGCYYFDPATFQEGGAHRGKFDSEWEAFLARERSRGVAMPYFLGAEPALEEQRLLVAARYFRRGNLGTNGTVRLDPEIPFRISISAWAADEGEDARLRGGSALRKALRLYQGDSRAIILYTVNPANIDQVPLMARICRDYGLPLTFNLWSPTTSLLGRLEAFTGNDDAFFRISTPEQSLLLSDMDLGRVRDVLAQATDDFPDTVIYSAAYNRWSTRSGSLYELDPQTGIAEDCGSRIVGSFKYYGMDLRSQSVKCCTPAVDCQNCRLYSGGWSSQFSPRPEHIRTLSGFADWIAMVLTIGRIFLRPETDPEIYGGSSVQGSAMEPA